MKFARTATFLATAWALAGPAQAAIFTFTGDTTGKPTYNRPFEDLSGISPTGTGVHYDTFSFTVGATGDYTVLTTGSFDTFITLYVGSFLPASALTNAFAANDDLIAPPFTTSGLGATLSVGATYILVMTGFNPNEFGAYSTTIGGPGAIISSVPEPAGWGLLGLGLASVALRRRSTAAAANDGA